MIPRFNINYQLRDFCAAIGVAQVNHEGMAGKSYIPGFSRKFDILFTYRGSEALFLILKTLALPPKARVGLPLYTCSAVAKSILAAGMTPVYLESDPSTLGISQEDLRQKASGLDCLVLVHLFGYPADFREIAGLMPDKPIIEDCAHALGSSYQGQPLGSLAEQSFFSFGLFKPLGVGLSGALVTRNEEVASKARAILALEEQKESFPQRFYHAAKSYLLAASFRRPYHHLASWLIDQGVLKNRGLIDVESTKEPENILKKDINIIDQNYGIGKTLNILPSSLNVFSSRIKDWRPNADYPSNQEFWSQIRELLPIGWEIPGEPAYGTWNHFIMPIRTPNPETCARAIQKLKENGIGADHLYPDRRQELGRFGYRGECPNSELISNSVFTVPAYPSLGERTRQKIITTLKGLF